MSKYSDVLKNVSLYGELTSFSYIKKINDGEWRVFSRDGKNLGTFNSKEKAKKRLKQIEFFKRTKKASQEKKEEIIDLSDIDELSYSAIAREIRKKYSNDIFMDFLNTYKSVFDILLLNKDEDIVNNSIKLSMHLFGVKHELKLPMSKVATQYLNNADPKLIGKYLSDIVKFLMNRISQKNRQKSINKLKYKFYTMDVNELANKKLPASSSMGQAITFVKNVLFNNNPHFITKVLNSLVSFL